MKRARWADLRVPRDVFSYRKATSKLGIWGSHRSRASAPPTLERQRETQRPQCKQISEGRNRKICSFLPLESKYLQRGDVISISEFIIQGFIPIYIQIKIWHFFSENHGKLSIYRFLEITLTNKPKGCPSRKNEISSCLLKNIFQWPCIKRDFILLKEWVVSFLLIPTFI